MSEALSLDEIRKQGTPASIMIDLQLCRFFGHQYSVFVALIHRAIDYSAQEMSRDKNTLVGLSEDQLTLLLSKPLKTMGFDIHHDKNNGGHCDIVIEGASDTVWLGEAKKFSSYGQILGGYRQLTDRYSTGIPGQNYGALIIYMDVPNAKSKMDEWRKYLCSTDSSIIVESDNDKPLEFRSEQNHSGSGLSIHVRHVPILLYHKPTDVKAPPKRVRTAKAS